MPEPASPEELRLKRETFFKLAFGTGVQGYICISYMHISAGKKRWEDVFFQYPSELPNMLHSIERNYKSADVYFCPQVFASNQREPSWASAKHKERVKACPSAWADLDECDPNLLLVTPTISIESSPGRYQALWLFKNPLDPEAAEQISKNIAYHHVPDGADSSGWDLTQVLRVPYTFNFKRQTPTEVRLVRVSKDTYTVEDFSDYKESRINRAKQDPMPELLPTEAPLDMLQRYRRSINPLVFSLFSVEPTNTPAEGGWSKPLWQMLMLCFEAGMSREEVFIVASNAACNKYRRDRKHPRLLWEDVCRAYATTVEKLNVLVPETEKVMPLMSDEELASVEGHETFVERYIRWASSLGDAAKDYHQAGAFMILSALLAGAVRLPTSFGTIKPNLWFMLLGDTTLTRKTTAMDVAMDLVAEVDPDILLATDGSLEGMMQALEIRPGKPSLFKRDEVAGLIEAMAKKDYMAGMAEALTQLYDGKTLKRVLKRETVTVRDPCLLFFAGGIKTRVQSLLTLEHVASGFIPRFVFLTAESDISKLKPLGPPTADHMQDREDLIDELHRIRDRFVTDQEVIVKGQVVGISSIRTDAQLTDEAWSRYNILETTLLYAGVNHDQPDIMTPVYDRLSKSILKAAVLLAASRTKPDDETAIVELKDLLLAIKYGDIWKRHATDIVNGIGRSANEILLQRVMKSIRRHPGVSRSQLMQWYHLEARQAELMFATMEQRGLILATRMGRTWVYEAVGRIKVHDVRSTSEGSGNR